MYEAELGADQIRPSEGEENRPCGSVRFLYLGIGKHKRRLSAICIHIGSKTLQLFFLDVFGFDIARLLNDILYPCSNSQVGAENYVVIRAYISA